MLHKTQTRRPFFEVGDKVQLKPRWGLLGSSCFEGRSATITRIQFCPDPLMFENPEDWHQGPHWVHFWVKLDDFPGLDDHVKQMEIPFRYRELRALDSMEDFHT